METTTKENNREGSDGEEASAKSKQEMQNGTSSENQNNSESKSEPSDSAENTTYSNSEASGISPRIAGTVGTSILTFFFICRNLPLSSLP